MWPRFIFKHWKQLNFKISTTFQFQNHNPMSTLKYWKEFCIFIEQNPKIFPTILIWTFGRTFHLVNNLLLLHDFKRLRGHGINNSSIFLAESHISTTTSANYLGKYCVWFFRYLIQCQNKQHLALAIHILRSHDNLHLLLAHLQAFRCLDRASIFAAKKGIGVVFLQKKKVLVVICADKSNIRRVNNICTWTEMWKQKQKMCSLIAAKTYKRAMAGVRAMTWGQKGKRAKGQ